MNQTKDLRTRLTRLLASCYNDPCRFSDRILGRPPHFGYQRDIVNSVMRYRTTVVCSGNMIGKDWIVGGLTPFWMMTRKNSLCIVTGPSQTTLGSITFKEIRKSIDNSKIPLGAKMSQGIKNSPQTIRINKSSFSCLGFSTVSVEKFSGHHAGKLLVIVEEASGVDDEIWQAIDSLGAIRLLLIGNPIRSSGRFIDLFYQAEKDRRDKIPPEEAVNAFQLPSTVSPHIDMEHSPVGLADRTWLRSMIRQHGKDSLWIKTHVYAQIPKVAAESLLNEASLDACITNERRFPVFDRRAGVRKISADLAEGVGADNTVIWVRDDIGVIDCVHGNTIGLPEAAAAIAMLVRKWKVDHGSVRYDAGGLGSKFAHYLASHGIYTAQEYLGAGSPMSNLYTNIRSECGFTFRSRIDPGFAPDLDQPYLLQAPFCIPNMSYWPMLREELMTLSYELVGSNGKTRMLPKADHKARLGRSPDYSDSFLASWA